MKPLAASTYNSILKIATVTLVLLRMMVVQSPAEPQADPLPLNFFKNLQAGKQQTVIVYGTSLTALSAWPKALKDYFDTHFPSQVVFINAAKAGQTSNWGVANLENQVLSKNPDLVFLEFSVNDASTKNAITLAKSADNLDHMVQAMRQQNPQVDIVLLTMNTAWDSPAEKQHKAFGTERPQLAEYYDIYRKYAREHGLPLVDTYPLWKKLQDENEEKFKRWVPEGLHPIREGSLSVTWPTIEALLEKARSAVPAR